MVDGLVSFARDREIQGARVWGIGALVRAELGFYTSERKDYHRFTLDEELELLSLLGNLGVTDEGPRAHLHVVVGTAEGSARGGHFFEGRVGPTLEAFVVESAVEIRREVDERFGIPLIVPTRSGG